MKNIFSNKKRKGQFFLIAAVVIIIVIVSVVTISNYVDRQDVGKVYEVAKELGIESQNIIDYGTYNELNEQQMKTLMESFITNYVTYMESNKNIYFVYGNKRKVNVAGYQEVMAEEVCIKNIIQGETSETTTCNPYLTVGSTQEFPAGSEDISNVVIKIADVEYQFELSQGENFYFIIWQNIGQERIVVTGQNE